MGERKSKIDVSLNLSQLPDPTPKLTAKLYTDPKLTPEQQELVNCLVLEATRKAFEEAAEIRPKRPSVLSGWNEAIAAYADAIRALAKAEEQADE